MEICGIRHHHHSQKEALRATALFNDNAVPHFKQSLNRRQKQKTAHCVCNVKFMEKNSANQNRLNGLYISRKSGLKQNYFFLPTFAYLNGYS